MRPKKTRWIACKPKKRCFRPLCKSSGKLKKIRLTIDEFEALRLFDLERLEQEAIARKMKIHRSTVSRILAAARRKITDALVNLKAIEIEGGCCRILKKR